MNRIHLLPEHVKIAAGEVIERPESVLRWAFFYNAACYALFIGRTLMRGTWRGTRSRRDAAGRGIRRTALA